MIHLLGHSRTCHTRQAGPTAQLRSADWMIWPASRSGCWQRFAGFLGGPQREGPDGLGTVGEVREAVVDRIMVAVTIGMGLVFVTGVMVGAVLMVAMRSGKRTSARRPPRSPRTPPPAPSGG